MLRLALVVLTLPALALAQPPADHPVEVAWWHFARGVALARTGKADEARATSAADGNFYAVASGVARPFRQPEPSPQKRVAEQAPVAIARLRIESLGQTGARLVSTDVGDTVTGLTGVLAQGTTTYSVFPDPSARLQVVAGAMPRAVTAPLASSTSTSSRPR